MFSNVTLLFFILLIPISGFIAWAGDYIGHRTGKKRHSLFGLRPRHTALVFTIASGIAVVCASFAVFYIFSESFRNVISEGEKLYRNNATLRSENQRQAVEMAAVGLRLTTLRGESARLDKERLAAEEARNKAIAKAEEAEKRRAEAEKRRTEAEGRRTEAEKKLTGAETKVQRAEADLTAARADLSRTQKNLTTAGTNLSQSRQELKTKTEQVQQAEERLKIAAAELEDAKKRVTSARAEQKKAEGEARLARERADREVALARAELDTNKKRLTDLQQQLDDQKRLFTQLQNQTATQRGELARLTTELEQKRVEYATLAANTQALRGRQITYEVGEEVDRITLKPGMTVWTLRSVLQTFLETASLKAEGRGAARGSQERTVIVAPKLIAFNTTETAGSGPRLSSESDTLDAAANVIRRSNRDTLVRAVVTTNAVLGEPVIVELRVLENPIVLRKDDRIGEIILNGETSRQELSDAVFKFLSRDIHDKLKASGMVLPTRGGALPFDDVWLSSEEWFKLMGDVRKGGARPKLTVHAAKDLRAGDPVKLRFSVRTTVAWNSPPPIPNP